MTLVVEGREAAAGALVLANPSAVEQVLLNLVDNACKYAGSATDRRIQVELRSGAGAAAIAVRDHGPGISATVRRRLFRSFSKSARNAAETAPGIGLGLTLSRRLARDMGGDLRPGCDRLRRGMLCLRVQVACRTAASIARGASGGPSGLGHK